MNLGARCSPRPGSRGRRPVVRCACPAPRHASSRLGIASRTLWRDLQSPGTHAGVPPRHQRGCIWSSRCGKSQGAMRRTTTLPSSASHRGYRHLRVRTSRDTTTSAPEGSQLGRVRISLAVSCATASLTGGTFFARRRRAGQLLHTTSNIAQPSTAAILRSRRRVAASRAPYSSRPSAPSRRLRSQMQIRETPARSTMFVRVFSAAFAILSIAS